jgi:hypothetical protein
VGMLYIGIMLNQSHSSSSSIVSDYGLDNRGLIPDRGRGFFLLARVQTGSGSHPASYPMGTEGPFPGDKVWLVRDADHAPV